MTITVFLDPTQMPAQGQPQATLDANVAQLFANFPTFGAQINALAANLNSIAAGGAYAIPYLFSTINDTTVDPGAGCIRFNNPNQAATVYMTISGTSASGQSVGALIDQFDDSTSTVRGFIKFQKLGDQSKWIVFAVLGAVASNGAYRSINLQQILASDTNPFVTSDSIMLFFQRTGDKGDIGNAPYQLLAQSTVSTTAANIDFLSVFTSAYDKYVIELSNYQASAALNLLFQVAAGGAAVSTANYTGIMAQGNTGAMNASAVAVGLNAHAAGVGQPSITFEVCNVNSTTSPKSVGVKGAFKNFNSNYEGVGGTAFADIAAVLTGFRLSWNGAGAFSKATVRVYGVKNT